MSEEILKVSIQDKVATMTFNRPDKMNAINAELTRQAIEHLRVFRRDPDVGCIVLTGEGRAFCAGGDVSDMAKGADKAPTMEQTIDGLRDGMCHARGRPNVRVLLVLTALACAPTRKQPAASGVKVGRMP